MSVPYSAAYSPMKRHHARWTNHENEAFLRRASEGQTRREIAYALGRSPNSIHARLKTLKVKIAKPPTLGIPPEPVTVITRKAELIAYYELGWRVEWHEGDQVGLIWKSSKEPRLP